MSPRVCPPAPQAVCAVLPQPSSPLFKADRFQSALAERAYKEVALNARALNVISLLTAYQAEMCADFSQSRNPVVFAAIPSVTDLCLHIQCCAVQATGEALGLLVLQERARWLTLANLSDREKDDILDMPIVPDEIFGSALASI